MKLIQQRVNSNNFTPTLYDLERAGFDVFADPFGSWWDTYIPAHKEELINKFMHTYYFNQIGCEEPDRFRVYLNAHLERIMPYYNQMYESELIKFNPLLTHSTITRERSVENLVKLANSDKSSIGRALRDFVNNGRTTGETSGTVDSTHENHGTTLDLSTLDRSGQEREVENSTGKTDKVADGTSHEDNNINKKVTENPGEVTTTDYGKTTDKNGTGTSDTNETESATKRGWNQYSDTPQKFIGDLPTPDADPLVWRNYLTNFTGTGENANRSDNIGVKTGFNDHEVLGGADKTIKSGQNVTDTNEQQTKDGNTHNTDIENSEGHSDRNKSWSDTANGKQNGQKNENGTGREITSGKSEGTSFQNGRDDSTTSKSEAENSEEKQGKDNAMTHEISGFSGISVSELLKSFRDTFVNIDEMILRDLRNNFMEVY